MSNKDSFNSIQIVSSKRKPSCASMARSKNTARKGSKMHKHMTRIKRLGKARMSLQLPQPLIMCLQRTSRSNQLLKSTSEKHSSGTRKVCHPVTHAVEYANSRTHSLAHIPTHISTHCPIDCNHTSELALTCVCPQEICTQCWKRCP